MKNINRLIFGQININSIRNKINELKLLIISNLDILVVIETKLDDTFPLDQFAIDGFGPPYRLDRDKNGGGIMVYVRDDLASKEIKFQQLNTTAREIEGIFIEINLRKSKWLLFAGYNNKKSNIGCYLNKLGPTLDNLLSKYENLLVIGDFNSEIKETSMSEFCDIYNLKNLIKEHTCFKNPVNPTSIDLMLTNRPKSFQNSQTIETGLSDHHKMTLSVLKISVPKQAPVLIKYRDYKHYDSQLFQHQLSHKLEALDRNYVCYDTFQNIFMSLLREHAPMKTKYIRANNAPFMNKILSKAIMDRSRLKNKYLKHPSKENELLYKKQRNYCVNLMRREKKKFYNSLNLESITDSKRFWKTMKPFFSDKTYLNRKITLIEEGKIISNDNEVAETMNDFFSNAVKKLEIKGYEEDVDTQNDTDTIENIIDKFKEHPSILKIKEMVKVTNVFSFSKASNIKILQEIFRLNKNKPTTENNIPVKILVENAHICAPTLAKNYNDSVTEGNFPAELKSADMTPGHKKNEKTFKGNYRPVSVLPTVSKLFERLMLNDIDEYMSKFLSQYLCGFRKGFSTQHCLIAMFEKIKRTLDKSNHAAALLTDLSKAFDCINHRLLIAKLEAYGFSYESLKYIYSYLINRKQRTKINNSYSSWAFPDMGVPQGSNLGPPLFNIYTNDIFFFIDNKLLTNFADDNTPYQIGKCLKCVIENLENDALILDKWFSDNYLKMNAEKCHLLVPNHTKNVSLRIKDEVIKCEESVKLLGITVDNKLNFNDHVAGICKKASQKLHALTRIAPYTNTKKLKVLMKAFIESQFNYCPLVWMFHNRSINNRINRIHERALRTAYKDYESSFDQLLKKDNSFTIHERNLQRLATEIYKTKNDLAPMFMKEVFTESANPRRLRNQSIFQTTNVKSVFKGTETISYRGPQTWSLVPENIKNATSLDKLKKEIKNGGLRGVYADCAKHISRNLVSFS